MVQVFKYVDKFLTSLTNYLTFNDIFLIFVGLFVFTTICVFISTANSYEAKLIKAVDKFNAYFIDNPQINEDNLVAFNAKMKARFVPKQLRKSWQQFVLYRENKASTYMSFENCVSNPIKNSSYKRDTKIMNGFALIFSICALILNCYYCYETADLANVLSSVCLTPIIILLLNLIMQIFFTVKHSAIVSDLFQNYQYFEVNIDKATETLPDYVDYEVLFDRNEIKKGIPILYAYLQKRAEEEQRELERARLRNVEHEKFNFDDAGVEASLVLERAMQEAENYIAERKKYIQDIEQINSDITQEDMNYREITKEYNRQMQVSRETFANFKAQLEEASSSIEANYLKKQQQQELDRQRNLERDFDTATERHKKIIENYHAELDTVDKFIEESRKTLENAMKSEFSTYSSKVYDEVKKAVEIREKEKFDKLNNKIVELEEELVVKKQELDKAYNEHQQTVEELDKANDKLNSKKKFKKEKEEYVAPVESEQYTEPEVQSEQPEAQAEELVQESYQPDDDSYQDYYNQPEENSYNYDYQPTLESEPVQEFVQSEEFSQPVEEFEYEQPAEYDYNNFETVEYEDGYGEYPQDEVDQSENEYIETENFDNVEFSEPVEQFEDQPQAEAQEEPIDEVKDDQISAEPTDDSIVEEVKPASKRGRPRKVVDAEKSGEKKQRGRPRKNVDETEEKPKGKVGRPKKEKSEQIEEKRGPGRPKKVQTTEVATEPKRGRGRPKKTQTSEVEKPSKGRGRPRKVDQPTTEKVDAQPKKGRGRPKKVQTAETVVATKKGRGRPKKDETKPANVKKAQSVKKGRGRPKKVEKISTTAKFDKMPDSIVDIDEYIKQIDFAIAEENAKLEETQKELAKDAKLRKRKK